MKEYLKWKMTGSFQNCTYYLHHPMFTISINTKFSQFVNIKLVRSTSSCILTIPKDRIALYISTNGNGLQIQKKLEPIRKVTRVN